jgi:hypothetical protein
VISRAAIDAVTNPANLSSSGDAYAGMQAVRDQEVVAELRELEGLGAGKARQLGRDAVAHIGGQIEFKVNRGGPAAGRILRRRVEVWWVPRTAVRS